MEITYCDNCGSKIGSGAPSTGTAKCSEEGKIYCHQCAELFEHTTSSLLSIPLPEVASIHDVSTRTAIAVAQEPPRREGSVTKFFFCETCGKRITDKQILDGQGRDKKLKGVYCKDCAVGVMTMEMDAVNIEMLAKSKRKTPSPLAPEQNEARTSPNKASGMIRTHEIPQRHQQSMAAPAAKQLPLLLAIGMVIIVSGIVAWVVAKNQAAAPDRGITHKEKAETAEATTETSKNRLLADGQAQPELPTTSATTFETAVVPRTTEANPPDPAVQPAARTPGNKGRELFAVILDKLNPILQQHQFFAAQQLLTTKRSDPAFAAAAELIEKEQADLADARALRSRAMGALCAKAGNVVTLKWKSKGITGIVKAASNGESVDLVPTTGPDLMVSTDQLDGDNVDDMLPIDKGKNRAEDLRRRGLIYLFANQLVRAEGYFVRARDSGMGDAITPYLERIEMLKQEPTAVNDWKRAEELFAKKNWTEAKQVYESLLREHAGSIVLAVNAETLKQRLATIGR